MRIHPALISLALVISATVIAPAASGEEKHCHEHFWHLSPFLECAQARGTAADLDDACVILSTMKNAKHLPEDEARSFRALVALCNRAKECRWTRAHLINDELVNIPDLMCGN